MQRRSVFTLLLLFLLNFNLNADEISGFWQTMNKKTDKPSSVIAVYSYQGKYYGRIIATYDDEGVIAETIYAPKTRAPGIQGEPYYCGLDIVWDAKPNSNNERYKGYVVDPRKGKVYNAELWNRDGDLILRGELFIFGKNVVWPPFDESNFTSTFKKPDLAAFVPNIPKVKS